MVRNPSEAVVLRSLTVALGSRDVLVDVSHVFPSSSVTVILGPNGAGKTTLLRTLIGVIRPKKGSAFVMDHPAGSLEAKGSIGYLAEQPGLYERLTASENLLFHAKLRGLTSNDTKEEASALLVKYGLRGYERVGVQKFSKGMKQRLAFARTMLGSPPVLLLDEPTSGLDPHGSEQVIRSIRESAAGGAAVLMTTHNAYLARRVSDSVLLIRNGEAAASGDFDDVLRPYSKVRVKLMAPADPKAIREALSPFELELTGTGRGEEFVVRVDEKGNIPEVIRMMLDRGLKPVSIEPSEITYEGEAR
jgi:ABC-2 type transport system ATP-binding protein